jgi:hypothetical protein
MPKLISEMGKGCAMGRERSLLKVETEKKQGLGNEEIH